jgi:hypothetical protein
MEPLLERDPSMRDCRVRAGLMRHLSLRLPLPSRAAKPSLVLALASLLLAGCGGANADPPAELLRWPPPTLSNPERIELSQGYTHTTLALDQDATIQLPAGKKLGGVTIEGGNDIVIIGGEIDVPASSSDAGSGNRYRTGLYVKGATGTVHVEGIRFGGSRGAEWDAVDIASPSATVQLENIRVDHVRGSFAGLHGDVVQPWGGVRSLRIDRMTASSNYQGLMIPADLGPIREADLSHVDLHGLDRRVEKGGHLLWLTSGASGCAAYPVRLKQVYVEPRSDLSLGGSVWPERRRPAGCAARVTAGTASWPRLPSVEGVVRSGSPAGGPYVPFGTAGGDYVSPGYRPSGLGRRP